MSTFERVTGHIVKYIEVGDWDNANAVLASAFTSNGSGWRALLEEELEEERLAKVPDDE
jgi:hypothetical protein